MQYLSAGITDVGQRRKLNEDAFSVRDDLGLYVVADGMGGHAAGEVASTNAVEAVENMVMSEMSLVRAASKIIRVDDDVRRVMRLLESAVQSATYMVYGLALEAPEQRGMGTTLSALLLCGNIGVVAQVGDSRIYRVRDGEVTTLTEEHTLVAWQVKQGVITPAQALVSPNRNVITRAVGSKDYVQVDTAIVDVMPNDRFLLCSDGLHGYLQDTEIPGVTSMAPKEAVQHFISLANARGGKDNITAIVTHVQE